MNSASKFTRMSNYKDVKIIFWQTFKIKKTVSYSYKEGANSK